MQSRQVLPAILEKLVELEAKIDNLGKQEILSVQQAAEMLDLSQSTIYKMCNKRTLPYYKPSGKVYFVRSELVEWVLAKRIMTEDEIQKKADQWLNETRKKLWKSRGPDQVRKK